MRPRALACFALVLACARSAGGTSYGPGGCFGPTGGHQAPINNLPLFGFTTNNTLTQGVPATVTLAGPVLFKGYFVSKPLPAVGTLSAPSVGLPYLTCGFGHTEPSLKPSVSFTFVPGPAATTVSLTGFVVVTWSPSNYFIVNTTFAIAPAAPPPPPPPSPPPSPPLAPQAQPVTPAPTIVAPVLQSPPPPRPPPTTRAPLSDLGLTSAAWSAASALLGAIAMAATVVVVGA